jgi:hypothetical protein
VAARFGQQIANHWLVPTSQNVAFKRHINVEDVDCRRAQPALIDEAIATQLLEDRNEEIHHRGGIRSCRSVCCSG